MSFRGLIKWNTTTASSYGAYVKGRSGYYWKKGATGLGAEADEVTRALTAYRVAGGQREVAHVYSAKGTSKVIRSTARIRAVSFRNEWGETEYGWLDLRRPGTIVSEEDVRKALKGADSMVGWDAADEDSLQWKWDHASAEERAKMAEKLMDRESVNWDDIFGEIFYREDDELYKADEESALAVVEQLRGVMDAAIA